MQYLVNGDSSSPSNSASRYNVIYGAGRSGWMTDETYANNVIPTNGKIKFLRMVCPAPGAGRSWSLTLRVNGVSTSLVATATGAVDRVATAYGNIAVSAGDLVCVMSTPSGSPANGVMFWTVGFEPDNFGETIILPSSGSSVVVASNGRYISCNGDTAGDTTNEFDATLLMPISGTVLGMYGLQLTSPGVGNSRIYTLRKNSVDTSMTFTIANTATTGSTSSNTFTLAAGDKLSLRIDEGGSTTNTRIKVGIIFKPDRPDLFICSGGSPTNMTVGPFYNHPVTGFALSPSSISDRYIYPPAAWIALKMYAEVDVAPGVGQNRTFNSYNFLAQQGFQIVISGTNKQGNDDGALVSGYDFLGLPVSNTALNLQITASAGVATASAIWSYACRDRNLNYKGK